MLIGIDASRAVTQQRTGTEAYAYFLIRALQPLAVARGHSLRLYYREPPPAQLFAEATDVEAVVLPARHLWTHVTLGRELAKRPPDIFFTPAHVIPISYRGPSAATIHDLGYHHFPEAHPKTQLTYLKWSTRHNGRRARVVFADSQATMTDLIHFDHIPAGKIEVVYPGLDSAIQREMEDERIARVLERYGIVPPYLLYLSTLQPRKNVVRLIEAYAESGVRQPLVLAGKRGWLSQPLQVALDNLSPDVAARVILPGFVPDKDKAALLSGATALLYPSLYEGFGFPILEAQACGVPVLTATSSSCPEVAGGAALLVDPEETTAVAQGIVRLVNEPALRQHLITSGSQNAKRFSWFDTAERILDLLERAAGFPPTTGTE